MDTYQCLVCQGVGELEYLKDPDQEPPQFERFVCTGCNGLGHAPRGGWGTRIKPKRVDAVQKCLDLLDLIENKKKEENEK